MQRKRAPVAAAVLFVLGVLITMALAGMMAWAAFEGLSYFATGAGYASYGGMHCPVLISRSETGVVTADFVNPSGQVLQPYYEIEISGRVASRQLEGQVTVQPNARGRVSWTVTQSDIDLNPFIFVKMDVLPVDAYATREDTCGILVAGLGGISGSVGLSLAMAIGLVCLLAGLLLPAVALTAAEAVEFDAAASTNSRRAAQALGVVAVLALLAGLMGWWLVALLALVVSLLLLVMVVPYMLSGR